MARTLDRYPLDHGLLALNCHGSGPIGGYILARLSSWRRGHRLGPSDFSAQTGCASSVELRTANHSGVGD